RAQTAAAGAKVIATDEAVRMPELWAAALFREHGLRELRAAAGLFTRACARDRAAAGEWRLAHTGDARAAVPVLRQCRVRCLQLASPGRNCRPVLRRVPA